jgi:phospholipid:diacylglycerol acyltransferase
MSNLRKRNTPKKEKVVEEPCKEELKKAPFWKSSRFVFSIGVTIGLVGMYAASTTPAAQNQFNVLQDYLMMQVADLDLQYLLPQTDVVDEFLANLTTKLRPTPATDIPFQPATDYK